MRKAHSDRRGLAGCGKTAALVAILAALGSNPLGAATGERAAASRPGEAQAARAASVDLEEIFWICDYAATTGILNATEMAGCNAVTEQLKREKFNGDFERMLDWWRQNRAAQHAQLDSSGNAGGAR